MDRVAHKSSIRIAALAAATAIGFALAANAAEPAKPAAAPAATAAAKPAQSAAPVKKAKASGVKIAKAKKGKSTETVAADPVQVQAANYEDFERDVDKFTKMDIRTPKDVKAVDVQLMKHQPERLSSGWIAYSARMVAQNTAFSDAVKADIAKNGRAAVMDKIAHDSKYVASLPGAFDALDKLMTATANDTSRMSQLGDRFIKMAYAFQKEKWGMGEAPLPHYAEAPQQTVRVVPASFFGDLFSGSGAAKSPAAAGMPSALNQRILTLAASLNAGPVDGAAATSLTLDKDMTQCLRWARLNLNQCLAAAHFPSEHAYCTGKHGINEVSACWTRLLPTKS
jgi:hypothetical protein